MADLGQHTADLAVSALAQRDLDHALIAGGVDDGRLRHPRLALDQPDPLSQSLQLLRRDQPVDMGTVGLGYAVARVRQLLGQFAVVGH